MTAPLHSLFIFITQSVHPISIIKGKLTETDFEKWKLFIFHESQHFKLMLLETLLAPENENDKKKFLSSIQQQLVKMSDILNHYLVRDTKMWIGHQNGQMIRRAYLNSLSSIEESLLYASENFSHYYDEEVKITDFNLCKTIPNLRGQTTKLKDLLELHKIDEKLSNIVIVGLNKLFRDQSLTLKRIQFITEFLSEVHKFKSITNEDLIKVMIKMNFNQPGFYLYNTDALNEELYEIKGLHEQQEYILQKKDEINSIVNRTNFSLHPKEEDLKKELITYFNEKYEYLEQLMVVRRMAMQDKHDSEQAFRMLVGLSVPQLALFYKIQMEKGLLAKTGVSKIYNFVAQHFYTEKTVFISAQNLIRTSTNVEFSTALKLWEYLDGMIDWLDDHYSIKSYQRLD